MRTLRQRGLGFSLVEVLGATTVLTVGLTAAFYLVGLGTSINTSSKLTSQAYQAAQQEIEILRNMPYDTLASVARSSEGRFVTPEGGEDASLPGDTGYPGSVSALAKLPGGRGGLLLSGTDSRKATVVVRWIEPGGVGRRVVIGTVISKGGIDPR